MIWILSTVALLVILLFYFLFQWRNKKKLTKLRRQYEEENGYTNEAERPPSDWADNRRAATRSVIPEPDVEGDIRPEPRRILPATNNLFTYKNSRRF